MFENILYVILALLGLGFLIFIHELGHYFMARRAGMRVEVFSIGFGKPLYTWMRGETRWQIALLPFGGYVKIAGMQEEKNKNPYEIEDGFFSKKPWDRMKVVLAGPVVNLIFAFVAFGLIFAFGGRNKPFSEYSHIIGSIDPQSEIFERGVRPGDLISEYNGNNFSSFKDLLVAGIMKEETTSIKGLKVDYYSDVKEPFAYTLKNYESNSSLGRGISTIGIKAPAQYLLFSPFSKERQFPLGSPMKKSGIKPADRIIWADGELVFSSEQLSNIINAPQAFLTVFRNGDYLHTNVTRVKVQDLNLNAFDKAELEDWQYDAGLKNEFEDLYTIPYYFNEDGIIENDLTCLEENPECFIRSKSRDPYFTVLKRGDRIVAVDGQKVDSAIQILKRLQKRHVLMVVRQEGNYTKPVIWNKADEGFLNGLEIKNLENIIASIGTGEVKNVGNLKLLNPVVPRPLYSLVAKGNTDFPFVAELKRYKRELGEIKDEEKRKEALALLEKSEKKMVLGISLTDREVRYNPNPFDSFFKVFKDTYKTLYAVITGYLNPKWLAGPVGIVQVVHHSWSLGFKEALYWLGVISLNLGFLNLLPIPALDGGYALLSIIEMVTKKQIKPKTIEKLIIPFFILLILAILYFTYNDVSRLFSLFFGK